MEQSLSEFLNFNTEKTRRDHSEEEFEDEEDEQQVKELQKKEEELQQPEEKEGDETDKADHNTKGSSTSRVLKRKRKSNIQCIQILTDLFLRITYPITACMVKNISIGIGKESYHPVIILAHAFNRIVFNETSWTSFNKYVHLIECYLENKLYGKKTRFILANSDIEIENVKMRGNHFVRFRNVTKHDEKVLLSVKEVTILFGALPAIERYMEQLKQSSPMIKDYLEGTLEMEIPLLYAPVDSSVYNRLPQEVHLYRVLKTEQNQGEAEDYEAKLIKTDSETEVFENEEKVIVKTEFVGDDEVD